MFLTFFLMLTFSSFYSVDKSLVILMSTRYLNVSITSRCLVSK